MFESHWAGLLYFFVVGGIFFAVSLWLPFSKGDIRWQNRDDRRTAFFVTGGFAFYLVLYVLWEIYALG